MLNKCENFLPFLLSSTWALGMPGVCLSTHRALVASGTVLLPAWVRDWGLLFTSVQPVASPKVVLLSLLFLYLILEKIFLEDLIAPSSPYSLSTSFPSSISQCLPDTNPVLSLPSWDLDLTFYYVPSAPHNSVSSINGYKSYVLTPQSHLLFPLYHSFSFVRIRHCRTISASQEQMLKACLGSSKWCWWTERGEREGYASHSSVTLHDLLAFTQPLAV